MDKKQRETVEKIGKEKENQFQEDTEMSVMEKDLTQFNLQPQKQLSKEERKKILHETLKEVTEEYRDVFEKLSKN